MLPSLRKIEGHRGAFLLRRQVDREIEFVVLTLWTDMGSVRRFAGQDTDKAVVEAEAKRALISFDDHVLHFEVVNTLE